MGTLIAAEVVTLSGTILGLDVMDIKLRWLLPFVWLLFESVKSAAPTLTNGRVYASTVAESRA